MNALLARRKQVMVLCQKTFKNLTIKVKTSVYMYLPLHVCFGSPRTYMKSPCNWLIKTIEENKTIEIVLSQKANQPRYMYLFRFGREDDLRYRPHIRKIHFVNLPTLLPYFMDPFPFSRSSVHCPVFPFGPSVSFITKIALTFFTISAPSYIQN